MRVLKSLFAHVHLFRRRRVIGITNRGLASEARSAPSEPHQSSVVARSSPQLRSRHLQPTIWRSTDMGDDRA